jgi:hypothetical protein
MSSIPVLKDDLAKYHNDKETVIKTARQVIKDFDRFGYEIDFPADICYAYDDLFEQLAPLIRELLNLNLSKLYSLLYSIDLNEKTIKKAVAEMADLPLYEVITHLILERELRKVLTREYFSRDI